MGVVYLSYSSIAAWVLCVSLGVYSVYVRSVNFDLLCRYQKHSMHSIASIFRVANDDRLKIFIMKFRSQVSLAQRK